MNHLAAYQASLTPEQKAINLAQAQQASRDAVAERLANEHLYTLDYMDSNYWQELASQHSVRMPIYNQPCTTTWMRKYINRVGVVGSEWLEAVGLTKLQQWINLNPKHTLYAFVGNLLEYKNGLVETPSKTV